MTGLLFPVTLFLALDGAPAVYRGPVQSLKQPSALFSKKELVMSKRSSLPMDKSKSMFSATANRTHRFNLPPRGMPMRGGIRM